MFQSAIQHINTLQQGGQTCAMLRSNVAYVWPGLYNDVMQWRATGCYLLLHCDCLKTKTRTEKKNIILWRRVTKLLRGNENVDYPIFLAGCMNNLKKQQLVMLTKCQILLKREKTCAGPSLLHHECERKQTKWEAKPEVNYFSELHCIVTFSSHPRSCSYRVYGLILNYALCIFIPDSFYT